MSPTLRERLEDRTRPLILDGGLGTAIRASGFEGLCEILNYEDPFKVEFRHIMFARAGAELISTNTFCADRATLHSFGHGDRAERIWRTGVEVARRATFFPRDASLEAPPPTYVCGSIGPTSLAPEYETDLRDQILEMLDEGVDALLVETCTTRSGALLASRVAREVASWFRRDVLLFVSFTVSEHGEIAPQSPREGEADELSTLDADLVALNCGFGPNEFDTALRRLRSLRDGPIGAYPNAGLPIERDGRLIYPIGPDDFAKRMRDLAERHSLALVGGCCGTNLAHIRALARAFPPDDPPIKMPPT